MKIAPMHYRKLRNPLRVCANDNIFYSAMMLFINEKVQEKIMKIKYRIPSNNILRLIMSAPLIFDKIMKNTSNNVRTQNSVTTS